MQKNFRNKKSIEGYKRRIKWAGIYSVLALSSWLNSTAGDGPAVVLDAKPSPKSVAPVKRKPNARKVSSRLAREGMNSQQTSGSTMVKESAVLIQPAANKSNVTHSLSAGFSPKANASVSEIGRGSTQLSFGSGLAVVGIVEFGLGDEGSGRSLDIEFALSEFNVTRSSDFRIVDVAAHPKITNRNVFVNLNNQIVRSKHFVLSAGVGVGVVSTKWSSDDESVQETNLAAQLKLNNRIVLSDHWSADFSWRLIRCSDVSIDSMHTKTLQSRWSNLLTAGVTYAF